MSVFFRCQSCDHLQQHNVGFYTRESFDSAPSQTGGDATCEYCGAQHRYLKRDLIWRHDKNPHHQDWEDGSPRLGLDDLFDVLDASDPRLRDQAMMLAFITVVNPQTVTGQASVHDRFGDLHEPVNYRIFKDRCRALASTQSENIIVHGIVQEALDYLFRYADATRIPELVANHRAAIERFRQFLRVDIGDVERQQLEEGIIMSENKIASLPSDIDNSIVVYERFCEEILPGLLKRASEPDKDC